MVSPLLFIKKLYKKPRLVPVGLTDLLQTIEQQAHNLEFWKKNIPRITFLVSINEINAPKNKYNTYAAKLSPKPPLI
jgi:hypothetical protein